MRLSRFFLIPVLALAASSIGQAAEVGDRVPSCQVQSMDGSGQIDLAGHPGKVVYIDFWASWCGPCAESFPFLDQLSRDLGSRGLVVIGTNLDEDPADAEKFLRKRRVGFTIGRDADAHCPELFGVTGMPSSYLVDRKGVIRHVHRGFRSGDKKIILDQVMSLLGE